jgi:hypothetical protein
MGSQFEAKKSMMRWQCWEDASSPLMLLSLGPTSNIIQGYDFLQRLEESGCGGGILLDDDLIYHHKKKQAREIKPQPLTALTHA